MKVCVITGGSRGIGAKTAEMFVTAGFSVVVLDIIASENKAVDYIETDLSNPDKIYGAFEQIKKTYGTAHILINNGAVAFFEKPILEVSLQEHNRIIETNLRGSFLCAQAFIKLNQGQDYGRIINISSTRHYQNEENWEVYGMTKGALVSLTNSLCVSLRGLPITVNTISPGYIETGDYDKIKPKMHAVHPSNRAGRPQDIGNVCLFLAEEDNDFINGADIFVDGGMSKRMIYE